MAVDAPTTADRIDTILGPQAKALKSKYAQWRLSDLGVGGDGSWARFKEWASSPDQGSAQVPDLQNAAGITQQDVDRWAGVAPAAPPPALKTPDPNDPSTLQGVSAEALQLVFNNTLALANNAVIQLNKQGLTPVMKWDQNAYGKGIGGFVPTSDTVPIVDATKQQFDLNRTTIDQMARVAYQSGRVPRTQVNAQGMIEFVRDASGQPIFDESVESRLQRTQAANAIGAIPSDLLRPPTGVSNPSITSAAQYASTAAGIQPQPARPAGAVTPTAPVTPVAPAAAAGAGAAGATPPGAPADGAQPPADVGVGGDAGTGAPDLSAGDSGWAQLDEGTRQGFVNQWGEPQAQARWEWENANNAGQNPGAWEDFANMRMGADAAGLPPAPAADTDPNGALPILDPAIHGDGQPAWKRWLTRYTRI